MKNSGAKSSEDSKKFIYKNETGIVMPLVLIVLFVVGLLGTTLWVYGNYELNQSVHEEKRSRAYYLARAGAESLAKDLMINPEKIESLIPDEGDEVSLSDYEEKIDFKTDYSGEIGTIDAKLNRKDKDKIEITGTGTVDGTSESVSILLEVHGLFDGLLYAEGDLDFHQHTKVRGDIYTRGEVTGGDIEGEIHENEPFNFKSVSFPPNKDYPNYPGYPLADEYKYEDTDLHQDTIFRIQSDEELKGDNPSGSAPDGTLLAYEKIEIHNQGSLKINATNSPVHIRAETFEMDGELELKTSDEHELRIFVNYIDLDHVEVTGNGVAEIFVYGDNSEVNVQTPHAKVEDWEANLIFYLDDGCEMEIQANAGLQGLVYGPGAYVRMQGGTFEGSMIAHEVTGQTPSVEINTELFHEEAYKELWDKADIDLGYVMVHWLR